MSTTRRAYRTTEEVLTHHLKAFADGDLEAITEDYAEEAILIWAEGVVRGKQEIRAFFDNAFTNLLPPGSSFDLQKTIIEGETAYILWQAESTTIRAPIGSDTFIIHDGMIVTQTFAGEIIPKGA